MLTLLHAVGWCLVDFFKQADFLVIQGTKTLGGGGGGRSLGEGMRSLGIIWYTIESAMSIHPCNTGNVAFQGRWLLIGGSFIYKMPFWGIVKWPPIEDWLLKGSLLIASFTVYSERLKHLEPSTLQICYL